jgi:phosphatidylserine/phosphatidylglycerophosphate/cardiolipin synthase-like enzyme
VVRLAFATGTRAIFSPRPDLGALAQYAQRAHDARDALFMTFAFGMDVQFQEAYRTGRAPLRYALMEAMSGPTRTAAQKAANEAAIIALRRLPANKFAVGAFLKTGAFDRWLAERLSGLNRNVRYVHTKYLMTDPLGPDPLVITGSANFSRASTTGNDENMLVIRGDARVADIYLGEFMRMYNHFAFREWLARRGTAGTTGTTAAGTTAADPALYLDENDRWWQRYFGDGFAARQRRYFVGSPPLEAPPAPSPVPSPAPPPA